MKRSYGSSNSGPPPTLNQASPYAAAYAQPAQGAPPLPPGPPPGVAAAAPPNPYAGQQPAGQYGYDYAAYAAAAAAAAGQPAAQGQQAAAMAAHPQYPGYGYGQAATPAAASPSPYSSVSIPDPNAAAAAAAAQQYAAYYAAYAQHAQQTASGASPSPYGASPAPPNPYGQPAPPPPQFAQQPQQAYGMAPPPPSNSPGAPPYKRTRYDQPPPPQQPPLPPGPPPAMSGGMPPSVLPPLGGRGGRGGGRMGGGRGGGRMDSGPPGRGGHDEGYGPRGGGGGRYDDSPLPPRGNGFGGRGGRGGGSGLGPRGAPGGGGRGIPPGMAAMGMGMGDGYGPNGTFGGGRGAPSGPRGPRDDRRGGRDPASSSGRPLSGLPVPRPRPGAGVPAAPKGPKALSMPGSAGARGSASAGVNQQTPRRGERKWGTASSSSARGRERDEKENDGSSGSGARRTLTDFRIEGLSIPELDWEWKAERVEKAMKQAAEELDRQVKEKGEGEKGEEPNASAAEALSDATAVVKPEEKVDGEDVDGEEAADMSIDHIPPTSVLPADDDIKAPDSSSAPEPAPAMPSDPTSTAQLAAPPPAHHPPKHGRDEEDDTVGASGVDESGDAVLASTEAQKEKEARDAKKVRVAKEEKQEEEGNVNVDGEAVKGIAVEASQPPGEQKEGANETTAPAEGAAEVEVKVEEQQSATVDQGESVPSAEGQLQPKKEHDATSASASSASAALAPPSIAPAAPRENSRLRIYFSSPVAPASSYTVPVAPVGPSGASRAGTVPPTVLEEKEGEGDVEPVPTPVEEEIKKEGETGEELAKPVEAEKVVEKIEEVKVEELPQPDAASVKAEEAAAHQDDEDVDGEAIDGAEVQEQDVDGEPLVVSEANGEEAHSPSEQHAVADAGEQAGEEEDEDDDDELLVTKADEPGPASAPSATGVGEDDSSTAAAAAPESDPIRAPSLAPSTASASAATLPAHLIPPEPAADRISISYARNTRRMLVDADVVESVKIVRGEARIELTVRCKPALLGEAKEGEQQQEDEFRVCRGILVEALDPEADDYIVMDRTALELAWQPSENDEDGSSPDPLLPPLHRLLVTSPQLQPNEEQSDEPAQSQPTSLSHDTITVTAQLDKANPLTEARWVKTGEVENWILSLGISNGADPKDASRLSDWRGKIKVVDPDPPPTIQHALNSWATSSNIGNLDDRKNFVKTHMSDIDNVVEILLRLTRGDRSAPSHSSYSSSNQQTATVGALAATLSAPFPDQQTQVSLAVLAMFRLSVETAQKAGIPKEEVEKQVAEIVRGVPYHLTFKALDGMFREVRGKGGKGPGKGGRGAKH
ncbi:hypothetical protein JCM11251_003031 [Rhodosporidiobolus azoricus]